MDHQFLTILVWVTLCHIANIAKSVQSQVPEFDDDEMGLTEDQFNALTGDFDDQNVDLGNVYENLGFMWGNGTIPYEFNSTQSFEESFKTKITNAIDFLNQNLVGCILIRPKEANDIDYFTIHLNDQKQRRASVGRRSTKNEYLILDPTVTDDQSIFHEILHIAGLLHEHQRPDRDAHVEIHDDDNIAYTDLKQFRKFKNTKTYGFDYDPYSIMHYHSYQGTLYPNNLTKYTITSKVPNVTNDMLGSSKVPTYFDLEKLRAYYACPSVCKYHYFLHLHNTLVIHLYYLCREVLKKY